MPHQFQLQLQLHPPAPRRVLFIFKESLSHKNNISCHLVGWNKARPLWNNKPECQDVFPERWIFLIQLHVFDFGVKWCLNICVYLSKVWVPFWQLLVKKAHSCWCTFSWRNTWKAKMVRKRKYAGIFPSWASWWGQRERIKRPHHNIWRVICINKTTITMIWFYSM